MPEIIWREDGDWLATRLHPKRRYYPPKLNLDPDRPYNPDSRWHPGMVCISGAQGFEIGVGKYKTQTSLILKLALEHPFDDDVRKLAIARLARWDDTFNTWDFPILSQLKHDALEESWALVEEIYLSSFFYANLEFHWHYDASPQIIKALKVRINQLNGLWKDGTVDTWDYQISLVYPNLSREEVEQKALAYIADHGVSPLVRLKDFENVCINYLRHCQSAYHLLLKTEQDPIRSFRQVNRAIATAYPWLKNAAERQISKRGGNGSN